MLNGGPVLHTKPSGLSQRSNSITHTHGFDVHPYGLIVVADADELIRSAVSGERHDAAEVLSGPVVDFLLGQLLIIPNLDDKTE